MSKKKKKRIDKRVSRIMKLTKRIVKHRGVNQAIKSVDFDIARIISQETLKRHFSDSILDAEFIYINEQ